MFKTANLLPTYENIEKVYEELELPLLSETMIENKKERLIMMIINLLRVKPQIFMQQINMFKVKCDMRQRPKNLVFLAEDVEQAIELLEQTQPTHPLELNSELCAYARSEKKVPSVGVDPEE